MCKKRSRRYNFEFSKIQAINMDYITVVLRSNVWLEIVLTQMCYTLFLINDHSMCVFL